MPRNVPALVGVLAALAGCANPPVFYGDNRYPALSETAPIHVYMKESDIRVPYDVIATITAMDLGKYQMLTIQDLFPTLEAKARAIGANAVIVDGYQPVKSGIFSTGYSVYGRAVRVGEAGEKTQSRP